MQASVEQVTIPGMRHFLRRLLGRREGRRSIKNILAYVDDPASALELALRQYLEGVGAERGCILWEIPGGSPQILHCGPAELAERFPFSRTVVDTVLDEARGFYSYDSAEEVDSESLNATGSRSFVCTPIVGGGVTYGVIYLDNPIAEGIFSPQSLEDLEKFAALLAEALAGGGRPSAQVTVGSSS